MNIHTMRRLLGLLAAVFWGLMISDSHAISDCAIGLTESSTEATIDGQLSGGEWDEASVLNSATSPCLERVLNYQPVTDNYPEGDVIVHSMRYTRSERRYVAFAFEIDDSTPCSDTSECVGENVAIQFNPVINGDEALDAARDRRIIISHKWEAASGSDQLEFDLQTQPAIDAPSCSPATGTMFNGELDDDEINVAVRSEGADNGYIVEVEVSERYILGGELSFLQEDIGVAIAVINDFARDGELDLPSDSTTCGTDGPCFAAGGGFPADLGVYNGNDPIVSPCQVGWTRPAEWGVGYLQDPPGTISISRSPSSWNSDGITVKECDELGYSYYPEDPCRVTIEAEIDNSGATQTRKVLYLWSPHGTGEPEEYHFVGIEDAVIDGNTTTVVEARNWGGMPAGQPHHPCLRVYILPDDFDEDRLPEQDGIITRDELSEIVVDYGVERHHWAQKNISRDSEQATCPDPHCGIIIGFKQFLEHFEWSAFSKAYAQGAGEQAYVEEEGEAGVDSDTGYAHVGQGIPGSSEHVDNADVTQLAEDHVIAQVRTLAYRLNADTREGPYNYVEDFGGVVQAFPVDMVRKNKTLPVTFSVSNASDVTRQVQIVSEVYSPDSSLFVKVDITPDRFTLKPGAEHVVTGELVKADPVDPEPPATCFWPPALEFLCALSWIHWLILLVVLMLILAAMLKKARS